MRRIYILLVSMLMVSAMYGNEFVVDGIKYDTDVWLEDLRSGDESADKVKVLGLENPSYSGSLVIPESVTYNQKTYSVKYIKYSAFEGCAGLTSVTLPNTLLTINYGAFKDCTGLSSFNIPASVTSIKADAFVNTAWYNSQPDGLVYKDNVLLTRKGFWPKEALEIANGTRLIAATVFQYCFDLPSVTLPSTLEYICDAAFFQSGITSINIPASVKKNRKPDVSLLQPIRDRYC